MAGTGRDGPTGRDTDEFVRRLEDFGQDGSAVLVVGGGSREVHVDMCRRLLGDDSAAPRRRMLVFTNGTFAVDERVPGEPGPDDTRVVTTATSRSTAAAATQTAGIDVDDLGDASLAGIGVALVEGARAFERRHGTLEAGELRIGVDSLAPLLDAHGERAVFGFLVLATAYVRHVRALGHFHLPVDVDSSVAGLLAPLFDAVVEVRVRKGQPQQRWHLDDGDVTSRWLSL